VRRRTLIDLNGIHAIARVLRRHPRNELTFPTPIELDAPRRARGLGHGAPGRTGSDGRRGGRRHNHPGSGASRRGSRPGSRYRARAEAATQRQEHGRPAGTKARDRHTGMRETKDRDAGRERRRRVKAER
jgi:hypothetical protein